MIACYGRVTENDYVFEFDFLAKVQGNCKRTCYNIITISTAFWTISDPNKLWRWKTSDIKLYASGSNRGRGVSNIPGHKSIVWVLAIDYDLCEIDFLIIFEYK